MDADAIIIGAGAAGLAAARQLANRSFRTIVLEARDRVGGRVWSRSSAHGSAELGAEFIHGPAAETMALLRAAGMDAVPTGGEAWTCDAQGGLRRDEHETFLSAAGIFDGVADLARDESVAHFLQRFAGDRSKQRIVEDARAFVEGFDAADPAIASARAIAAEWHSGVDSRSARPVGGYAPMFARLLHDCITAGASIRLANVVRRIAWRRGLVTVAVNAPSGEAQTLTARAAIVTLPAGVLRDPESVVFEPELPSAKREALAYIETGHVVRIALRFRAPFWERVGNGRYRDAAFFRCAGLPFAAYWTQAPIRSNLIVAWAGGPKALELSGAGEPELVERALAGFGALLGEPKLALDEFLEGAMHDWTRDPFALGAYSYIAAGGDGARERLAASLDGTLFFAGEAVAGGGQGGTVNGALQTGERAAAQVAAALETTV
ncbi:MAG TPA: NAD(P)/FAD-dependent oxidoreductase [Candidatus Tumulicola sp.]